MTTLRKIAPLAFAPLLWIVANLIGGERVPAIAVLGLLTCAAYIAIGLIVAFRPNGNQE